MNRRRLPKPTFHKNELLQRRSLARRTWDLVGLPLRFVPLPDSASRKCGWSSLEEERLQAALAWIGGPLLDIGAGTNTLVRIYGNESVGVDVFDFGNGAMIAAVSTPLVKLMAVFPAATPSVR